MLCQKTIVMNERVSTYCMMQLGHVGECETRESLDAQVTKFSCAHTTIELQSTKQPESR